MNRNQTLLTGISLAMFSVVLATTARAQVAINTDASSPDASAMLDIKSTARGFLAPRMTSAQRTAIATPAEGLWVYDTDTKTFWYYLNGTGWQQFQGGGFTLPYSAVFSSPSTLFSLTNTGSGGVYAGATTDAANVSNALNMTSATYGVIGDHSQGNAGNFFVNNTSGVGAGVRGEVNSIFGNNGTAGVYGTASGTGGYGGYFEHSNSTGYGYALMATSAGLGVVTHIENTNAANAQNALEATTNGMGSAASFYNSNSANTSNTVYAVSNGPGVIADHSQGNAGNFFVNNTSGVGAGVRGEVNSIFGNNGTAGVYGTASGTGGYGGYFEHSNSTGYGYALMATSAGLGVVTHIENTNTANAQNTLEATTNGTGSTASFSNGNSANTSNTVYAVSNGPGVIADHSQGNAGNFFMNNTSGVGAGVRGEVNSIFGNNGTAGVYGVASGTGGYGGYFEHSNSTGYGYALMATSAGQGIVSYIENTNNANTSNALYVTSNGPGVIADHSSGNAGSFFMNNNYGVGAGVRGEVNSIFGNNGTAGVYGVSSGTGGYAGYFEHTETTGYGIGVQIINYGHGTGMVVDAESDGDIAVFQKGGFDKARIDNTGRGYFNGGTQNSGADLAEAFDVEGPKADYAPGDVLVISTEADRTLAKSAGPYSTLVAGVYATRPGVLLTEDSLSAAIDEKVPMGVVGVIPTKVCNENGAIHRGDILVTSSRPGYAMRADPDKLKPGQSIGKALAEFSGYTGLIKVLVNVK